MRKMTIVKVVLLQIVYYGLPDVLGQHDCCTISQFLASSCIAGRRPARFEGKAIFKRLGSARILINQNFPRFFPCETGWTQLQESLIYKKSY